MPGWGQANHWLLLDHFIFENVKFNLKHSSVFILPWVFILLSCYKDFDPKQQPFPLIRTLPVINNGDAGVQFNGEVIKLGTEPVLDHGFIWGIEKTSMPGPDTFLISLGTDLKKDFSVSVSHKLIATLKYQVKAYVAIGGKTVYGEAANFTSRVTSPTLITAFRPNNVLEADTLTIFGENFYESASEVTIGINSAYVLFRSLRTITVLVPAVPRAGPVGVKVNAFYGEATSNLLTIVNPSITSFSPTQGSSGQVVTLNGRFSNDRNINNVFFNGVGAYLISSTKSTLTVYVPSGVTGNVNITINVNGKTFTTTDVFLVK
jgi:hypothetical protein